MTTFSMYGHAYPPFWDANGWTLFCQTLSLTCFDPSKRHLVKEKLLYLGTLSAFFVLTKTP